MIKIKNQLRNSRIEANIQMVEQLGRKLTQIQNFDETKEGIL